MHHSVAHLALCLLLFNNATALATQSGATPGVPDAEATAANVDGLLKQSFLKMLETPLDDSTTEELPKLSGPGR